MLIKPEVEELDIPNNILNEFDLILENFGSAKLRHKLEALQISLVKLLEDPDLRVHTHSTITRIKDPTHLRAKLVRKWLESESNSKPFEINSGNYLTKINDLVGVRVLHLYTRQMREIDPLIRSLLEGESYPLVEDPFARTWDIENSAFFRDIGIECQDSKSMYTSVHYVVSSFGKEPLTAEIQVRTLSEEVWGEVDHAINYPEETSILSCKEQIRALARTASATTRLVDSIFATYNEVKSPPIEEDQETTNQ
jgi:putative GTP pyrophosphokinase